MPVVVQVSQYMSSLPLRSGDKLFALKFFNKVDNFQTTSELAYPTWNTERKVLQKMMINQFWCLIEIEKASYKKNNDDKR